MNQLSSSTNVVASLLTPFIALLSTKNEFIWSPCHDTAFTAAKQSLTTQPTLSYFDLTKPTRLSTDASWQGLGYILQQLHGDTWSLVQAGSRFLSDAESHYAIIELELLAVAWAVNKCRVFLAGLQHFSVITDHNPLIPILNHRRLDEIENPRLQRLKSRLMAYNFTARRIKGKGNTAPDALSRNPVSIHSGMTLLLNMIIIINQNPQSRRSDSFRATNVTARDYITYAKKPARTQNINNYSTSLPRASRNTVANYRRHVDIFGMHENI